MLSAFLVFSVLSATSSPQSNLAACPEDDRKMEDKNMGNGSFDFPVPHLPVDSFGPSSDHETFLHTFSGSSVISHFHRANGCAIIDSSTENRKSTIMPQLIVRKIEEKVVKKLKEQAGQHGVSMEEEHRRILREALLGNSVKRPSFKEALLSMPNVGEDKDFERGPQIERPIKL